MKSKDLSSINENSENSENEGLKRPDYTDTPKFVKEG